jgi:hypothetical protein
MHSVREHFRVLGYEAGGSTLFDFFGHFRAPAVLSLQRQMERTRRAQVVHLNFIELAYETLPADVRDRFRARIDFAIHRAREIYDQAGLGVARIKHGLIEDAFAGGFPDIGSDGEADDLCGAWSVDNDGIDVFMVQTYANSGGSARQGGSCDKDGKDSGVVVPVEQGDRENTATAVSHEIGHFLGLGHSDDQDNLMFSGQNGRQLTSGQIARILCHCLVTQLPEPAEVV